MKFNEIQREKMVTALNESREVAEKIDCYAVTGLVTDLLDKWGIGVDRAYFPVYWEAKEHADHLKERYIKYRGKDEFYAVYINLVQEHINL